MCIRDSLQPGLDEAGDPTLEWTNLQEDVETFLTDKILIGSTVTVAPPTYVDAVVNLQYTKLPQYTTAEIEAGIKQTIVTLFGYTNAKFEETIYPQDIEFVLQQTAGIKTAKVLDLHRDGSSGLTTLTGAADEIFRFQETNISMSEI